jgi:hypothetical protein
VRLPSTCLTKLPGHTTAKGCTEGITRSYSKASGTLVAYRLVTATLTSDRSIIATQAGRSERNELLSRRIPTAVNRFVLRASRSSCDRMRTPTCFDGPGEVMCYTAPVPRRLRILATKRGNGKERRETGHQVGYSDVACVHADNLGDSRSTQRPEKSRRDDQLECQVLLSQLRAHIEGTKDGKAGLNMIVLMNPSEVGELPIQSIEAFLGI